MSFTLALSLLNRCDSEVVNPSAVVFLLRGSENWESGFPGYSPAAVSPLRTTRGLGACLRNTGLTGFP